MGPFVLALRAVGSQLAMRLYIPAVIVAGTIMALLVIGTLWLTTLSEWWWLLFIPLTVLLSVVFAIAAVLLLLIRFVRPDQTREQKRAVGQFVDKIQGVSDVIGTPKFIILFRVIRSIAAPSKDKYLSNLVKNRELAGDFRELQRSFDSRPVVK